MSGNIFVAFLFNKIIAPPDDDINLDPLSWVQHRLAAANIPLTVSEGTAYPTGVYGLPYMNAEWAGLGPEVQVYDEEDYRALVFLINQNRFYRVGDETGRRRLAEAFRDACNAIAPVYGILDLIPRESVPDHLLSKDSLISGLNTSSLARSVPDLLFVHKHFIGTLADSLLPHQVDELAGDNGIILTPDGTLDRWV